MKSVGAEGRHRELAITRLARHPWSLEAGSERQERQRRRSRRELDQLGAERRAGVVEPVQVLEQHAPELALLGPPAREALVDLGDLALHRLRREPRCGPQRIGHAEELEHDG
jgi:hypothetical protein